MRTLILVTSLILFASSLFSQSNSSYKFISEIHYDNNYDQDDPFGIDSIEWVEIYLEDPQPTDLTSYKIVTYDEINPGNNSQQAEAAFVRDLTDAIASEKNPNGKYWIIEFVDSTFFTFPTGGIRDGEDGVALVEIGSPNIVHDFWRYETCEPFTALDGPAAGAVSLPITTDRSRVCGSSGVFLVQMNSALNTDKSIQQNGFGDWELGFSSGIPPFLENSSNVPVRLMQFDAEARGEKALLTWSTAQEVSNDYFAILHSTDKNHFTEVGRVKGKGDYSGVSEYSFTTKNLSNGKHYFQLKQVDYDGHYERFDIKGVKITDGDEVGLYPSLAYNYVTLSHVDNDVTYQIYNMQGQLMNKGVYDGSNINVSNLDSGLYLLNANGNVLRFTKY